MARLFARTFGKMLVASGAGVIVLQLLLLAASAHRKLVRTQREQLPFRARAPGELLVTVTRLRPVNLVSVPAGFRLFANAPTPLFPEQSTNLC